MQSADVYVLLGDIGMEEERFDSSAIDYESALKLLMDKLEVGNNRTHEMPYLTCGLLNMSSSCLPFLGNGTGQTLKYRQTWLPAPACR